MNSLQLFMAINIAFRDSFFYQEDSLIDTSISTIYKINLKAGKLKYVIPYIRTASGIDSVKISFYEENEKIVERRYYTYKNEMFNIEYTFETSGEHQIEIENTVSECCLFARVLEQGLNTSSKNSYPNGYNNTSNISEITIISVGSFMSSFGPGCFSGVEVKFDYNNDYYNKFNAPTTIGYEAFSCKNINGDNYTIKLPYKTPDIKPLAFSNTNVPITLSFTSSPSSDVLSDSTSARIISSFERRDNIHTWFDNTSATIEFRKSSTNNTENNPVYSISADKKMSLQQVESCSHYFYNKNGYNITDGIFYADGNIGRGGTAKRYNYFDIGIEQTKRQRLLYELKYCSYPNTNGSYIQSIPIKINKDNEPLKVKKLKYKSGYNNSLDSNGIHIDVARPDISYNDRKFEGYFLIEIEGLSYKINNSNNENKWEKTITINDIEYYLSISLDVIDEKICYKLSDLSGKFSLTSYEFDFPTRVEKTDCIPSYIITPYIKILDENAPYDNVNNSTYKDDQSFSTLSLIIVNNDNIIQPGKCLQEFSITTSAYNIGKRHINNRYYLLFGIFIPVGCSRTIDELWCNYFGVKSIYDNESTSSKNLSSEVYDNYINITQGIDPKKIEQNISLDVNEIFINQYNITEPNNQDFWIKGEFIPLIISRNYNKFTNLSQSVTYYFPSYKKVPKKDTIEDIAEFITDYSTDHIGVILPGLLKDEDISQFAKYAFLPIPFPAFNIYNRKVIRYDRIGSSLFPAPTAFDLDTSIEERESNGIDTEYKYDKVRLIYYPISSGNDTNIFGENYVNAQKNRCISCRSFNGYNDTSKGIDNEQALENMTDVYAVSQYGGVQTGSPIQYSIKFSCSPSEF